MVGITCELAQRNLAKWLEASEAVAGGKTVHFESGGVKRILTQNDVAEVQGMIDFWDRKTHELCGGRSRTSYLVPSA